jgi:hypothetical protein
VAKITDPIGWDQFTETERRAARFMIDQDLGPLKKDGTASSTAAAAFELLLHAPMHSLGLYQLGRAPWARLESGRRAWGAYEHEWVDEVLALDSGNLSLADIHLPLAVGAGIRPEAIEAIRDNTLDTLTEEEANFVSFVRQAAAGKMDDDIYAWMKNRLGSDYAVIDYIMLILILVMHTRLHTIFDYHGPTQAEFDAKLAALKEGREVLDVNEYEHDHIARFKSITEWLYHLDDNQVTG